MMLIQPDSAHPLILELHVLAKHVSTYISAQFNWYTHNCFTWDDILIRSVNDPRLWRDIS